MLEPHYLKGKECPLEARVPMLPALSLARVESSFQSAVNTMLVYEILQKDLNKITYVIKDESINIWRRNVKHIFSLKSLINWCVMIKELEIHIALI